MTGVFRSAVHIKRLGVCEISDAFLLHENKEERGVTWQRFINNRNYGEYIISNCVYNLGTDIHQQGNVKYEMYTLEGTDVSEV